MSTTDNEAAKPNVTNEKKDPPPPESETSSFESRFAALEGAMGKILKQLQEQTAAQVTAATSRSKKRRSKGSFPPQSHQKKRKVTADESEEEMHEMDDLVTSSPGKLHRVERCFKNNWRDYSKHFHHLCKFPTKAELYKYIRASVVDALDLVEDEDMKVLDSCLKREGPGIFKEFGRARSNRCSSLRVLFVQLFEIEHKAPTLQMVSEEFVTKVDQLNGRWYTFMPTVLRIMSKAYGGCLPTLIEGHYRDPRTQQELHLFEDFTASDYYFYKFVIEKYLLGQGVADHSSYEFDFEPGTSPWPPTEWRADIEKNIVAADKSEEFKRMVKSEGGSSGNPGAGEEKGAVEEKKVHYISPTVVPTQADINNFFTRRRSVVLTPLQKSGKEEEEKQMLKQEEEKKKKPKKKKKRVVVNEEQQPVLYYIH